VAHLLALGDLFLEVLDDVPQMGESFCEFQGHRADTSAHIHHERIGRQFVAANT
jgi:hypothetical protein